MGLWTPASVTERKFFKCLVPGCGRQFPDTHKAQYQRHVSACAKRNIDHIQQVVEDRRDYFTEPADKEMAKWVRQQAVEVGGHEANRRLRGRKGR